MLTRFSKIDVCFFFVVFFFLLFFILIRNEGASSTCSSLEQPLMESFGGVILDYLYVEVLPEGF